MCPHARAVSLLRFQSTLLMRGATSSLYLYTLVIPISIHAPHARSDCSVPCCSSVPHYFNPRSSCEERRHGSLKLTQSYNFNPRSSCEERLVLFLTLDTGSEISIHAPHARSDRRAPSATTRAADFNPRSSCEERQKQNFGKCLSENFNPRSSCEERPLRSFLPTIR